MLQLACMFTLGLILLADKLLVKSATRCGFASTGHLVIHFKDRIVNNQMQTERFDVHSAIECGSICMKTGDCVSFFYNEDYLKCSLHPIVFTNTSEATVESGSMYYIVEDIISGNTLRNKCDKHPAFSYVESTDREVKLCFRHSKNRQVPFSDAKMKCERSGARLLQLETPEKIQFVTNLLCNDLNYGGVWLGATLINETWRWDNSNNVINNFNWHEDEPDGIGSNIKLSAHSSYKWFVTKIGRKTKRYMCEVVMAS